MSFVTGSVVVSGDLFDQRKFHDEVLTVGPVPLSVLEKHIDDWIAATADAGRGPTTVSGETTQNGNLNRRLIALTVLLTSVAISRMSDACHRIGGLPEQII